MRRAGLTYRLAGEGARATRSLRKMKRLPGNLGSLFFQGRIVLTEIKTVKTFWRNLMSPKRGVSRNISEINIFRFNDLQNRLIVPVRCSL